MSARAGRHTPPRADQQHAAPAFPARAAHAPPPAAVVRAALVVDDDPAMLDEAVAALVVDDDPAMLDEAVAALAAFPDAEVKCATTLAEAERLARRRHFDLALVGLGLPNGESVTLIRRLARPVLGMGDGPTLCVARAAGEDDPHLVPALAAGARGCVFTGHTPARLRAQLLAAIRGVPPGAPPVAPAVVRPAAPAPPAVPAPPERASGPLSPRETEVLRLVARGLTIAEAAAALGVSENTVKAHVKRTYAKLDVRTRVGAAREARRLGLLCEDDDEGARAVAGG